MPKGWQPIAWGTYKRGKASFTNIGTGYTSHDSPTIKGENFGEGCLYLPICYTSAGELQPLNYPFIAYEDGKTRILKPEVQHTETIQLFRKYPRKRRIIEFAERMQGGYFELANRSDFSDAQTIHLVSETPQSNLQTITLATKSKYRYLRFYKRKGGISIGEMGCHDAKRNIIVGKAIADAVLREDCELSNICDGDILSYFDLKGMNDIWVGTDFGKPMQQADLFFCPRTDDNDISIGDTYELFYWDKRWHSLGKQVAEKGSLTYHSVPRNALLWLRNLTKGHEERPFTYDNGKQIWW